MMGRWGDEEMGKGGRLRWALFTSTTTAMKRLLRIIFFFSILGFLPPSSIAGDGEWARVVGPRVWTFPRDHGAHPEYRTEWWYFTGNLQGDAGSRYGYQLTFFRQGVRYGLPATPTPWDIRDVYLAHFAITDLSKKKIRFSEKISRAGPGLAGASTEGLDVWLLNWSVRMKGNGIFLHAKSQDMELELKLIPRKPLIVHGLNGFSKKGPGEGQASYYTSFTDLTAQGFIKTDASGNRVAVKGKSWFDHEFGSNQLAAEQKGWDWFSLRLSDGRDLMIYFLRLKDGSIEPASSGTLIELSGAAQHLKLAEISVSVLNRWKSPRSQGFYPSRWKVKVPSAQIELDVMPLLADQELNTEGSSGIIYWEGAVAGQGTSRGRKVSCEGYVELTGYAGSLGGLF